MWTRWSMIWNHYDILKNKTISMRKQLVYNLVGAHPIHRVRVQHPFQHFPYLIINHYLTIILNYHIFTFFIRKCSKFYTMYSCLYNIFEKDLSETANSPRLVSYLPWTKILVGFVNHRGRPWISSSIMHPKPQTSIPDMLLYSFTY